MRGIDEASIGQRQEFGVQRIEEERAKIGRGPAKRCAEIGAADVADEESVSGEDGMRFAGAASEIVDEDGN